MATSTEHPTRPVEGEPAAVHVLWMTAANFQRFTYGPLFRHFRKRNIVLEFDQEPSWRGPPAPDARAPGRGSEP